MCDHKWDTPRQLTEGYVYMECKLCHDSVTVTSTGIMYDFGDEHGDTSTWGEYFENIKEVYKQAAVILAENRVGL